MRQNKTQTNPDFFTVVNKDRFAINYKGERILTMEILIPGEPKKQVEKNTRKAQSIIRSIEAGCSKYITAQSRYEALKNQN